ncbi:universal stress protein [Rufibacter quisquiliarum]|uniref:Nucleotide-binding universal stress UspA family protein n=1 Tax=Rufibacter quisquiliarum TaxID=1549639 RepID=A0A839GP60_9BACT|nr:universal stress protein [Rufibacter quisquiliarum]MBA9076228.1 nucleotide-binding universal stress UspA family protein [Rufibacter quisquiliarum]
MKKIICPVDFSKTSNKAAEYAAHIAQRTGASLTLLHVLHLPIMDTSESAMMAAQVLDEQRLIASDKLHSLSLYLQGLFGQLGGANFVIDSKVQEAFLADAVERLVKEEGFDFVVMGTTGGGNALEEILIGSNTESVISQVKCPVLAIPSNATFPEIHRIVYASDYQPEDSQALGQVLALGAVFQAEVEVVHVSKSADAESTHRAKAFIERIRTDLGNLNVHFQEVVHPDEETGLKEYLSSTQSNMLAILKKRRSFFKDLFRMSLAEKLTYQTKLPLLVLHADAE